MSSTEGPRPDIVVGIDFGMTGTAVAWALTSANKVNSITTWPGNDGKTVEALKVPSAISLSGPNGHSAWGFQAFAEDVEQDSVRTLFKPWLDESFRLEALEEGLQGSNPGNAESSEAKSAAGEKFSDPDKEHDIVLQRIPMKVSEAEQCLQQYLSGLCDYIKDTLKGQLTSRKWMDAVIWFRFSYPATWNPRSMQRFESIVRSTESLRGKKHLVVALSLNEAEAAAASFFADEKRPPAGQIILIADLGGCTTDMSTFRVNEDDGQNASLGQVSFPDARYNGSLQIDSAIRGMLRRNIGHKVTTLDRFKSLNHDEKHHHIEAEVDRIVREDRNYLSAKHGFKPNTKTCEAHLTMKDLKGQPMGFKVDLARRLRMALDKQSDGVWDQIEGHVEDLPKPGSLGCLVLTGGVSNNRYIQERLRKAAERYQLDDIIIPETPELAVSQGLVHEALGIINGSEIFRYESVYFYGVVVSGPAGDNKPVKLVSKGKAISTKYKKTKTIKVPKTGSSISLVRWSETKGENNNYEVACLTDTLGEAWKWKVTLTAAAHAEQIMHKTDVTQKSRLGLGKEFSTDVEVTFGRQTVSVTLVGDDGERHKRVFNEEWHNSVIPADKRRRDPFVKPLWALVGPVVALLGFVYHQVEESLS